MTLKELTSKGRIYQSTDINECYEFCMMFDGEFSSAYYEDFMRGIFTVILTY